MKQPARSLVAALPLMVFTSPVLTQQVGPEPLMAIIETIDVDIIDDVQDGCLPRPDSIKDAAKAELVRLGFGLDSDYYDATLYIGTIGNVIELHGIDSKICVLALDISLHRLEKIITPHLGWANALKTIQADTLTSVLLWEQSALITDGKATMQSTVRDLVVEQVARVAVKIAEAKQRFLYSDVGPPK